jgi:hypothetical protein
MPARGGDWSLLGEASDPIVADVPVVHDLVHYYTTIADEITSEAAVLQRIGEGDESQFKGETANAVRKKSKEVAASLQKMSGRYNAIRDALTGYLPDLEGALEESAAALRDAEDAAAAGSRADAMSDPTQGRAPDAPPVTADEESAAAAKHRATDDAKSAAGAATARLRRAVDALNAAGKRTAGVIRAGWKDGLHDTLGDKIKAFFSKLLKILVKIFTFIGIALAALAFIIPGVGVLAIMGAVAAGVGLVAQIGLVAMGEGNILDLVMAVVGVATLGIGSGIGKATSLAVKSGITASKASMTAKLAERLAPLQRLQTQSMTKINAFRAEITGSTRTIAQVDDDMSALTRTAIAQVGERGIGSAQSISARLRQELTPLVEHKGIAQGGRDAAATGITREEGIGRYADHLITSEMKSVDRSLAAFAEKFKDNPNWWNLRAFPTVAKNDWSTISKQFGSELFTKKGFDGWLERFAGIDGQLNRANMDKWLADGGFGAIGSAAPRSHTIVNGGLSAWGKSWSVAGLVINPVGVGADQSRPWTEQWNQDKGPITV